MSQPRELLRLYMEKQPKGESFAQQDQSGSPELKSFSSHLVPEHGDSSPSITKHHTPSAYVLACPGKSSPASQEYSVVSFSYVEKSNVKALESPCRKRTREQCSTADSLRKHPSDPVWLGSPDTSCKSSPELVLRSSSGLQQSPILHHPHWDPIGRAATQRAVQEFGSPLLQIKLAHAVQQDSPWCYRGGLRCRSLAGSPVQHQKVHMYREMDRSKLNRNVCQTEQLSCRSYTRVPSLEETKETKTGLLVHGPSSTAEATSHLSHSLVEGLNQLSKHRPSIVHSSALVRRFTQKEGMQWTTSSLHDALGFHFKPFKMNIPLNDQPDSGSSKFPRAHSESLQECCSIPGSPAQPSHIHRPTHPPTDLSSPLRDPKLLQSGLRAPETPTLHRHQPPQFTGDSWSTLPDSERGADRSDSTKSLPHQRGADTVLSCRQTEKRTRPGATSEQHFNITTQQKRAEQRRREILLLGPVALDSEEDGDCNEDSQGRPKASPDLACDGAPGAASSSRSSSGVTGSFTDPDCVSPESSTSSHNSNETRGGSSGIQTDHCTGAPVPSLHCQRIARAKWEFLFGTKDEDTERVGERNPLEASTAPPSGNSSESPTPTLPLSLALPLANHAVQQVEVELVTPPPAVMGASPKTGIIRRTLKYSETDLDAIPLRCYRETDIDEVLLAEQEDADSAFGSNRSVLGTPGNGSGLIRCLSYGHIDKGDGKMEEEEEEEEEEQEQEEEKEEMVSWASVRMQGDSRKDQLIAQDKPEVFGQAFNRPRETFFDDHSPALKSPVLVCGPRLESEDTFSRHFESIMESHRAKGTSYSSLDSEEPLASSSHSVLTFDLPTLTHGIHGPFGHSARHIVRLSFAPLAHHERPSDSDSVVTGVGDSDATRAPSSERLSSSSDDSPCRREFRHLSSSWDCSSSVTFPSSRNPSEHDVSDRCGLSSSDTLTNGSHRADAAAAKRLAKRLFSLDGFRKSDVAPHLSKNNDFSRTVAEEYLRFFDFTGQSIEQALRSFLLQFALMGESQERERVLSHFSKRYSHCNRQPEDAVHTLTCALMLLNTDLHGQNIRKRMSCSQFIVNLQGLNQGQDFPREMLKALYNSIKTQKLQWTLDEEELRKSFSELGDSLCDADASTSVQEAVGDKPLYDGTQPTGTLLYKNGFLVRKVHADCDGKRTPRGKRGWKTFYAILKGLILYLQKGEYRPDKQLSDEDLKNAVSIHHSLAMKASDYSKRPNVFYLRTADWRLYLLQAPNAEQMQSWITRINTVAAMFSSPPFPAAIGSQKKFSRPLLPGTSSKLCEEEQVRSHEARFRAISTELAELRSYPPDRKVKGRELEEFRLRDEYLDFEKTRYGTYIMLLRAKIRSGEEDLSVFESVLLEDSSLHRAPSSPTLQDSSQASQPSPVSSHRDATASSSRASGGSRPRPEGQRHSYRQAVKK